MRIHLPRGERREEPKIYRGVLRDIKKFGEDLWQIKITVPALSIVDNMYLSLDEEEIKFLKEWIDKEALK